MANDLTHLIGQQIQIKLSSSPKALACTVKNAETTGLWVAGSTVSQMAVQIGLLPTAQKQVVFFIPYSNVDWFAMAEE